MNKFIGKVLQDRADRYGHISAEKLGAGITISNKSSGQQSSNI